MRLILQRVAKASVAVAGEVVGRIESGLLILAAVERGDTETSIDTAAAKIAGLRLFSDEQGKSNLSLGEVGGAALVVSQFTLLADASRGRRPSFVQAAPLEIAAPLVQRLSERLRSFGIETATGRFGADMRLDVVLDGPFTLILEFPPASRAPSR